MGLKNVFLACLAGSPRTIEALPEQSVPDNGSNTQPASSGGARKSVRLGQRELLYAAVRDVMIRAGVLVVPVTDSRSCRLTHKAVNTSS